MWGVGSWRRGRGAREPAAGKHQRPVSQFALWRRRLIADQALEKVLSIIRVRQYELKALVEEAMASPKREGSFTPELRLRLERAEQLVEESTTAADSGTTQKDRTSYKTERGGTTAGRDRGRTRIEPPFIPPFHRTTAAARPLRPRRAERPSGAGVNDDRGRAGYAGARWFDAAPAGYTPAERKGPWRRFTARDAAAKSQSHPSRPFCLRTGYPP
jgi:hypothetical protein